MKTRADVKKEVVRWTILDAATSYGLIQKMELIDTLQRIGVDYHYKKEIHELLRDIYYDTDGGSDDLCITSLRFYFLRKHGYKISPDAQGNISSDDDDVNCMITLYNVAHLRTY
ncbi:hypothetical protein PR202_gb28844 [Eleusine coracana subsp. coracana]|uniref:Terpene synthase N-terminal domain-containing protein n=1 Tax=Eleusine coracana subsp. coracana TaxID=191504 RepID=A0AAV5FXZ8_ELECO|nr:hypothetical protein PR202_gb28844 [Eleusine coracana subsp. coracana]